MSELKLAFTAKSEGIIHPHYWQFDGDMWLMACVFQGLTAFDSNLELEGRLLKSIEANKNNDIWIAKLKKNLLWHDNKKIVSNDIKYTYQHIISKDYTGTVNRSKTYNIFKGTDEFLVGLSNEIKGIKVIDDCTIKFELKKPDSMFMSKLLLPIIPQHIYSEYDLSSNKIRDCFKNPIGSGAFIYKGLEENVHQFDSNESFHLGSPKVDRLSIEFNTENELIEKLKNGDIDFSILQPRQMKELVGATDLIVHELPMPFFDFLGLNHTNPLINNKIFREGLSLLIDKKLIIDEIYYGYAECINQQYTRLLDKYISKGCKSDEFDLDKARQCFLQIDGLSYKSNELYFKNEKITFNMSVYVRDEKYNQMSNIIESCLLNIGIKIKTDYYSDIKDFNNSVKKYDMWLRGTYVSLNPDAREKWGEESQFVKQTSWYSDESFHLLNKAGECNDVSKKNSIYKKWSKLMSEERPIIFLCSPFDLQVVNSRVKGVESDPRGVLWNIHEAYICNDVEGKKN